MTEPRRAVRGRLGPYQLLHLLGAGGMGEVYRARDSRLGRDVAIKVLPEELANDQELLKRLAREARAVGQLNHPNIVAVYDVGSEDGVEYVVMELLEGETLGSKLAAGPLPIRKALEIAIQIARGLAAAHQKDIIHRDLKPDNVFITSDGRVKILDFGLAHQVRREGDLSSLSSKVTTPGTTVGTAAYMSPEQARGQVLDQRTDIFSFGILLFEMLTGKLPFGAETALETMYAILHRDPPDLRDVLPNVPPVLHRVVSHCLEKTREARFQSTNDLVFDLENCADMVWPTSTTPLPALAPPRRFPRAAWIAIAALVVVASAAFAVWQLRSPVAGDPSFRRLTFKPTLIQTARFTADGDTVVYSASRKWQPLRLNMLRIDRPESHALAIPGAELASISKSGEMAVIMNAPLLGSQVDFYPGGTLGEVPVLGGTPRQIADHVILADWTPDGRIAAWRKTEKGTYQLEMPLGHVLFTSPRLCYAMRVSPKGDQIAMNVNVDDHRSDIIVIGLDGKKRTLASAPLLARGMAWSPDGDEVWYATTPEAEQVPTVYAVTLDGHRRRVMRSPGWPWLHDISRDGTLLLGIQSTQGGILIESNGPGTETDLSWLDASILADVSPDGNQLLFTESWEGVQYKATVYMRRTDDSPAVRLGEGIALAFSPKMDFALAIRAGEKRRELILLPTGLGKTEALPNDLDTLWAGWLPDGRILINAKTAAGPRMFIQARDGSPPRPLTPPGTAIGLINPVGAGAMRPLSPDGRSLLVFDRDQHAWLFPTDGHSAPRPATGVQATDRPAGWSRDGRHIYVYPTLQMPVKMYDVDVVTGERRLLRQIAVADPDGVFRISPFLLMPDGHSFAYGYYRAASTLYTATGFQ